LADDPARARPPRGTADDRVVALLILAGLLLRLRAYLAARSLGRDEASLALNVIRRSFAGLLQPLDDDQGAPIGFLLLQKAAVEVFGRNEYALRLVPLLASFAALALVVPVARRLVGPMAAVGALALFVVAEPLTFYASADKQYACDVAVTLAILACASSRGGILGRPAWLAAVGAVGVWFSHPSAFVLAGVALAWLLVDRGGHRGKALAVAAAWASSFLVEYRISLHQLQANDRLRNFWARWFLPFPPRSLGDVRAALDLVLGLFEDPVGLPAVTLAAALATIGLIALGGRDRKALVLLVAPIGFALIASACRLYPASGRLMLFTVPLFGMLIAAGLDCIREGERRGSKWAYVVLLAALLARPASGALIELVRPPKGEELRAVLQTIERRRRPGDTVYVYFAAAPAYTFYTRYADRPLLVDAEVIVGGNGFFDPDAYPNDARRLAGRGRVWLVFAHVLRDDEPTILDLFGAAPRLETIRAFGATAYLYDVARPPPPQGRDVRASRPFRMLPSRSVKRTQADQSIFSLTTFRTRTFTPFLRRRPSTTSASGSRIRGLGFRWTRSPLR
jgi:hypothetical protein